MEVLKLNGALAAAVTGIDWDVGPNTDDFEQIEAALMGHGVLAVAAARMRPEQHVELAAHFGELEHHEFFENQGPGFEHITVLDSARGDRSSMWHIDEHFLEKPPIITMTRAIQLPAWGGDTSFVSLHQAFDTLSSRMQQYLDGLSAVHDLARIAEMRWQGGTGSGEQLVEPLLAHKHATHPVVSVHPVTGRRALNVSPTYTRFIEGLPSGESKAILDYLFLHMQRPEHAYRHRWAQGDLLIWDNRSVMHHAAADYTDRRVMHRISVIAAAVAE
jgi:taurine dioxygenase